MGIFDGLGRALARAFREGLDEETHGAPAELLLEVMVLAAYADGEVEEEESARMRRLLARHWSQFAAPETDTDTPIEDALADAERRIQAREGGETSSRALDQVAAALRSRGPRAVEEAYSLALAVLLATRGVEARERLFADSLRDALGLDAARAHELEAALTEEHA
jgi:uncharacterized membrane protein YebE (DUF533 family)